ncbi:helix-turn-helix domain-containing protein [Mycoplasmoides alvi]|uniref:hypothetical protein n=1 Tax=Mycoplasmoides alvi TaxID=78580 RepID=UPI000697BCB0|nr:hypothetical protein [Mycoplasmoides alvi]
MPIKKESPEIIKNVIELLELLAFYSPLLKEKQIKYFKCYYENNWSYAEISAFFKVSRATVCESITQTRSSLRKYEKHLQLLKKHKKRLYEFQKIKNKKIKNRLINFENKNLF